MDHRNSWRTRKFYRQQVDSILDLLKVHFKAQDKKFNEYLAICEKLGKEPDLDKMPLDSHYFPYEVQIGFQIHDLLPERWDGTAGAYLGKDWSALDTLLKVHKVEDKSTVIFFIKAIDNINANAINERLGEERKKQERKSQGKDNMNFPKGTT